MFPNLVTLGVGIPIGIVTFSWILYIFNLKYVLTPQLGWFATSVMFLVAVLLNIFAERKKRKYKKKDVFTKKELIFVVIIPSLFTCQLLNVCVLDKGLYSRGSAYGDLPFHLNIISSFVHGCNYRRRSMFDIKSVFYANTKLTYPILVNFLSSVLISSFKLSLKNSIFFPSLPMVFSIFILLASIVKNFTKRSTALYLSPWLFMFMSGRGIFMSLNEKNMKDMNADFAQYWGCERSSYWLHPLLNVIIPQRLSLFGIPVSFSYLVVMTKADFSRLKPFVLAGLIIALMPQLQAHACIAAFEWTLAYGVIHFPWKNPKKWWEQIRCYLTLGFFSLSLSVPQLMTFLSDTNSSGFFFLEPIWVESKTDYFTLWWDGLFIFWAISTFLGIFILTKEQLVQYIPPMFVYVVSNLMHYQPWNVDNSKVFYAGWVPFAVAVVANYFAFLMDRDSSLLDVMTYVLLAACNMSGAYAVYRVHNITAPQWETADFNTEYVDVFVNSLLRISDPNDVFLADSIHNHPIATLGGRQVLTGYLGWLITRNINFTERINETKKFMESLDPSYMDSQNVSFFCYKEEKRNEITRDIGNSQDWGLAIDAYPFRLYRRLK